MAYEKQTWKTGDVVTSAKLNHMEDGIASGTLVIRGFNYSGKFIVGTSDKTWQEIHDALSIGAYVTTLVADDTFVLQLKVDNVEIRDGDYIAIIGGDLEASTNSADGYPAISKE